MLSEEDRAKATCIHQALEWAQHAAASGEATTTTKLCDGIRQRVADGGGRVDYVEASCLFPLSRHKFVYPNPYCLPCEAVIQHSLPTAVGMWNLLQSSCKEMCVFTWQAVDAEELQPLDSRAGRHVLVAVAAFFGSVRLIDNVVLEPC